jgi:hypothetical protein
MTEFRVGVLERRQPAEPVAADLGAPAGRSGVARRSSWPSRCALLAGALLASSARLRPMSSRYTSLRRIRRKSLRSCWSSSTGYGRGHPNGSPAVARGRIERRLFCQVWGLAGLGPASFCAVRPASPPARDEVGLSGRCCRQFRLDWCVECLEQQGEVPVPQGGALVAAGLPCQAADDPAAALLRYLGRNPDWTP